MDNNRVLRLPPKPWDDFSSSVGEHSICVEDEGRPLLECMEKQM